MPAVGERKTKGGVTGEWDGTTWRQVSTDASAEAPAPASAGPAIGTRKTKNGITGEWDGTTWRQVDVTGEPETTPDKPSGAGALAASAGVGLLAAGVPVAKRVAEHVATSPALGTLVQKFAPAAGALNVGQSALDVVTGRKSVGEAGVDAAKGEAVRQVVKRVPALLQRAATPVAGMAAPFVAGGLAGVAGSTAFLGALQHDANRKVDIDYSKNTPDTAIARAFLNMRDSEKNRGKTLAERQDDPDDVMFQADDTATVTGGAAPGGSRVSDAVRAFFGRRTGGES
jgi:hypothetical protein